MAEAKHSGYKAEIQTVAFSGTQVLNGLTDTEWTNLSDEIDNSTTLYLMADLELVLASAAFSGADSQVEIYLVPTVDGTNYPNWTGNVTTAEQENTQHFIGAVTTSGTTEAQRLTVRSIALPPGKFKFGVRNNAGADFAGSGNTLKYRPWNYASS